MAFLVPVTLMVLVVSVSAYFYFGDAKPPTVWASNRHAAQVAMYRSSIHWRYNFYSTTAYDGLVPAEDDDTVILTVEPQETVTFLSGGFSRIHGCQCVNINGYDYAAGTAEYDPLVRTQAGRVFLTAPAETGDHSLVLRFTFRQGWADYFFIVRVLDH